MSQQLESLKAEAVKSRNLALYGKYDEAIHNYNTIIDTVASAISTLHDKALINEWNRLLEMLVGEKDLAQEAKDTLMGNFDHKTKSVERKPIRENRSIKDIKGRSPFEDEETAESANFKKPKKKPFSFDEDESRRDRMERDQREKERIEREEAEREKELREKEWEEREA